MAAPIPVNVSAFFSFQKKLVVMKHSNLYLGLVMPSCVKEPYFHVFYFNLQPNPNAMVLAHSMESSELLANRVVPR
jgi:hypothetical protein